MVTLYLTVGEFAGALASVVTAAVALEAEVAVSLFASVTPSAAVDVRPRGGSILNPGTASNDSLSFSAKIRGIVAKLKLKMKCLTIHNC